MLLHNYTLRVVLSDCNPSSQKVNALADLSQDISEVLPYLNTVLKALQYHHQDKFLTVKRKGHVITFWPRQIAVTKLEDEKEAREVIEELKEIVNETYTNKDRINPTYTSRPIPRPLDIFKLLPGTSCKKCGELTCFAFAVKLVGQEIAIGKCAPLFSDEFKEKRKVLLDLLHAAGYEVPGAYLEFREV
jgi:ArsR family metal-binding transcriptional regulator